MKQCLVRVVREDEEGQRPYRSAFLAVFLALAVAVGLQALLPRPQCPDQQHRQHHQLRSGPFGVGAEQNSDHDSGHRLCTHDFQRRPRSSPRLFQQRRSLAQVGCAVAPGMRPCFATTPKVLRRHISAAGRNRRLKFDRVRESGLGRDHADRRRPVSARSMQAQPIRKRPEVVTDVLTEVTAEQSMQRSWREVSPRRRDPRREIGSANRVNAAAPGHWFRWRQSGWRLRAEWSLLRRERRGRWRSASFSNSSASSGGVHSAYPQAAAGPVTPFERRPSSVKCRPGADRPSSLSVGKLGTAPLRGGAPALVNQITMAVWGCVCVDRCRRGPGVRHV